MVCDSDDLTAMLFSVYLRLKTNFSLNRDVVYIGVAITFLSILFSTVTQNVVTTDVHYLPSDNPDQRAGHVLRKDFYYDGTADFPKSELCRLSVVC